MDNGKERRRGDFKAKHPPQLNPRTAFQCEGKGAKEKSKETLIYSEMSFPRRRESRKINGLDPRLRGDDELISTSPRATEEGKDVTQAAR